MDAHFFRGTLCQMICWCFAETKPATTYLSELILSKAGIVEVTTVPVVWRPDSELWKASHPLDSSPSGLQSPLCSHSLGTNHPVWPLCLSFSLSPFLLLFHYLSPSLARSLPLPSSFSRFLSLQAVFTLCFQELPVSPDWLKQTLTLFWYLIQLCSFSSHRPWSMQSIRYPGSHRAPPLWLILDFKHSGTSDMVGKE